LPVGKSPAAKEVLFVADGAKWMLQSRLGEEARRSGSMDSSLHIGHRHILPVYPAIFILAASDLQALVYARLKLCGGTIPGYTLMANNSAQQYALFRRST
jgi:hypothetical protein